MAKQRRGRAGRGAVVMHGPSARPGRRSVHLQNPRDRMPLPITIIHVLFWSVIAAAAQAPAAEKKVEADGMPIAKIKESVICCPIEEICIDGWASIDVGGEIKRWYWDIDGDGEVDSTTEGGELALRAPREPKTYLVILTVEDNDGNMSVPDSATMHVMKSPPRVTLGPDTTVKIGVRVFFRPRVRSNCSTPERYEWDFDNDGTPEYHSSHDGNTSRVYYKPGTYYARFKVIDSLGNRSGGMRTIVVGGRHRRR